MIFESIKVFILALPLGIFLTFLFMVFTNCAIKVRRADVLLRKVTGYYCFSASVSGFMLLTYYYVPKLFALLDILFATSSIFSMVLFYHFFHYATKSEIKFSPLHYIASCLVFVVLFLVKLFFPEIWAQEGVQASLIIALFFGLAYSLLTLAGMQRYYIALSVSKGTPNSINTLQTTLYVVEVILFPVVFVFFPLVGGPTPGVLTVLLLMLSILMALKANIPFTYAIIRHYTSFETQHRSLFETIAAQSMPPKPTVDEVHRESEQLVPVAEIPDEAPIKKTRNQSKKVLSSGFDKSMFNNFMRSHKPYLNPDLTILDLAEMLKSNRSYISEFVNRAYKMNFSSYINLCRLREMERLLHQPKNKELPLSELISQTGFGTVRNYLRAQQQFAKRETKVENEENEND